MKANIDTPRNIDEYIADCPLEHQETLRKIRLTIRQAAPDAIEKISYQMPSFHFHGILVYFALFKKHIGFFPTGSGIAAFQNEIPELITGKGTIQFPIGQPVPYDLIKRIVEFRVAENLGKIKLKK